MSDPFDPSDEVAFRAWRARKLRGYPETVEALRVEIARPPLLSRGERTRLLGLLGKANMALIAGPPGRLMDAAAILALGRQLGLERLDNNLCADESAVSTLRVETAGRASEYIPYTNRPLSWHTDGYYNGPDRQVRAWMLYCLQDALEGGANALLDHEIAYLRLRDEDPSLVRALMHPQALTIPPNLDAGVEIRPASTGPVFSVRDGQLHMRYSARSRNVQWLENADLDRARKALERLFSMEDVYIFRHKLMPGEGYVSNNVLHNRDAFSDSDEAGRARVLLRVRYLDAIPPGGTRR